MDIFRRCLAVSKKKKKQIQLYQSEKAESPDQILCDNLIVLIVLRLPLKYAVQCKTLNKNFYDYISHDPTFRQKHALLSSSHINHTTLYKPSARYCRYTHPTQIAPKSRVSVLASSNGLLLVSIESSKIPYYVFNPITGEALAIHHPMPGSNGSTIGHPGLVVNLGDNETTFHHPFKLVVANKTHDRFRFEVIVPSGSSTRLKSRFDFTCKSFNWINTRSIYSHPTLHEDNQTQPVYLNDALHWLGSDLVKILVFDLKKEQAKIINGPGARGLITRGAITSLLCVWFGSVMGSLSFVYATWMDIHIHVHDYSRDVWQIQHKIANRVNPANARYLNPGMPLFFDGENLFLLMKEIKEEYATPILLYVHKISRNTWVYQPPGLIKHNPFYQPSTPFYRPFVPFLPTLAKVFDSDDDHLKKTYKGIKIIGADNNYYIAVCLYRLQQKFLKL